MTLLVKPVKRTDAVTSAAGKSEDDGPGAVPSGRRSWYRRRRVLLNRLITAVLFIADLTAVSAYGAWHAIEAPTYHLDGAFQTASGLLRLQAGDLPGRDFFPYLGIGPVFLLYPGFALTGGVLAGSVASAWSTTALVLALLVGVILALALRLRSFGAVFGAAGLLITVLVLGEARFSWAWPELQALLAPLFEISIPGNSLRPVRAAAPLILVSISVVALTRAGRRTSLIVLGAAFGVVIACWSNDFALAPSAVVLAFFVHHGVRSKNWRLKELAMLGGSLTVAFLISGFIATGGHYIEYLNYNFRDVLGDQFWYFGGWGPQLHVYSVSDLISFVQTLEAAPGIALLAGLLALVLLRPTLRWTAITALGGAALAGGTVAMIGGHFDDYFLPFRVWTVVAAMGVVLAMARVVLKRVARRVPSGRDATRVISVIAVISIIGITVFGAVKEVRSTVVQRAFVAADSAQTFVPRLGAYLPKSFSQHIADAPAKGGFVEEYAGLWTALRGPNRHQKVDAVIHAVGQERGRFDRMLLDPTTRTAVTTAPQMSAEWVTWNISANWWFYRELLHRFRPSTTSPTTLVWRRVDDAAPAKTGRCSVDADGQSILVKPAATGLNEVVIAYRGPGRGARAFSMLQNDFDSALDAQGFVALDPAARRQAAPIHVADREPRRYGLRNVPGDHLTTIVGCTVDSVPFPAGSSAEEIFNPLWATATSPAPVTDSNYVNGLGRTTASFLVNRLARNTAAYHKGARVRLANGQDRTVLKATATPNWLVVHLSGAPLHQDLLKARTPFSPVQ